MAGELHRVIAKLTRGWGDWGVAVATGRRWTKVAGEERGVAEVYAGEEA